LDEYGQIIIDECQAVAAPAAEAALRQVNVRYWTGLTATPYRSDHLDGLITMQCGPIRHRIDRTDQSPRRLTVHDTDFTTAEEGRDGPSIQAIYSELALDAPRNELIVKHVAEATRAGRSSLVLSNRLAHVGTLASAIRSATDAPVFELHGALPRQDRREVLGRVEATASAGEAFILVSTDKMGGQGLDLPSLDTLFLAVPVSFKAAVIQRIGRITRGEPQPDRPATVHDYRDGNVPVLVRMHARRRRVIVKEGFTPDP
ncbi:MAG: hypothetical protein LBG11_06780, partial [Bifidobacteriaceae bacterium]|nr:hypothetical protein [Bifidobacteriaceae bacterium]